MKYQGRERIILKRVICVLFVLSLSLAVAIGCSKGLQLHIIGLAEVIIGRKLDHDIWLERMSIRRIFGFFIPLWLTFLLGYYRLDSKFFENVKQKNKEYLIPAIIHWMISFYSDSNVFGTIDSKDKVITYLVWKLLFLGTVSILWKFIFKVISRDLYICNILKCAFPYCVLLYAYFLVYHPGYYIDDEINIFNKVINYSFFPYHFSYVMGAVYAMSLMLIPYTLGVVIVKIIFQSLICGYCVSRVNMLWGGHYGWWTYLLFLLPPVMRNGILTVRMQYYGLLYFVLLFKLIMDWKEKKHLDSKRDYLILLAGFSILAFWRREGFYLLLGTPVLISLAYGITNLKIMKRIFLSFLVVLSILYMPEAVFDHFGAEAGATYNMWFVNMCREGLDLKKYPSQASVINQYLSISKLKQFNDEYGDLSYYDNLIAMDKKYNCLREGRSERISDEYAKAIQYISLHEPALFAKVHLKLWWYTSIPSTLRHIFYDINLPLLAIIVVTILAMIKKYYLVFVCSLLLVFHWGITLLFAPAAYFKYYYQIYLFGWFLIIVMIILYFKDGRVKI